MKMPRLALVAMMFLISAVLFSRSAAAQTFPITIDVTALDASNFAVDNQPRAPNGAAVVVNLAPGLHKLCAPSPADCFSFTVGLSGEIGYGADVASFAAGQGTSSLVVGGFAVTIDATALSATHFYIGGGTVAKGSIPNALKTLKLIPGNYSFCAPSAYQCLSFTVKPDGKVDYSVDYDGFVSGRATSTLTVVGHEITIDATTLDAIHFYLQLGAVGGGSQPNVASKYRMIPGDYSFCAPTAYQCFTFTVKHDGKLDYSVDYDGFVAGRGTSTLTAVGYEITIDATLLDANSFSLQYGTVGGGPQTNVNTTFSLLPGSYVFCAPTASHCLSFSVTLDGVVRYDESQTPCIAGWGTDTLTIGCLCTTIQRGLSGQVADTQIANDQTSQNWGSAATMKTGLHDASRYQSLIRFDLGSLPVNQGIVSATMTLRLVGSPSGSLNVETHEVGASWAESTVTWSSFYASSPAVVGSNLGNWTIQGGTATRDLTSLVTAWATGARPNRGVRLTHANNAATFATSEAVDASQRPSLTVCYLVPQ